jgi:sulfur-oxidizing protein SoxY
MTHPLGAARLDRRRFLAGGGTAALVTLLPAAQARATPEALEQAIRAVAGSRPIGQGKVALELPPLVENGNTVPLKVSVASPMTEADHVTAIHVFNERNPQPHVMNVRLTPRAGRAEVAAHIKLASSQRVVALAELSDGSLWSASAEVIVTIAACVEDLT